MDSKWKTKEIMSGMDGRLRYFYTLSPTTYGRVEALRDDAREKLERLAKTTCSGVDPAMIEENYRNTCAIFPNRNALSSWWDPPSDASNRCFIATMKILIRCDDFASIRGELMSTAMGNPASRPTRPSGPTQAELRAVDRKALIAAFQGMADITERLCEKPDEAIDQYPEYCRLERDRLELQYKYKNKDQEAPADWGDARFKTSCGWDLLAFLEDPFTNSCSAGNRPRFVDAAGQFHRTHHPAPSQPNSPPQNGGGNRGSGGSNSGGSHCPENCDCSTRPIHCPVAPL